MASDPGLTTEEKKIIDAYLRTFTSDFGKIVMADMEKSLYLKRLSDEDLSNHAKCVERITEQNIFLKIKRLIERGADQIQTAEGVRPSRTPNVETEALDENDITF